MITKLQITRRNLHTNPDKKGKKMAFEHVSASSIKLFESCPRRWFYRYVLGRKESSSASMELGSAVHEVLEGFLRTGEFSGDGTPLEIAKSGHALLPKPEEEDLRIETSLEDYPLSGMPIPFKGFIDCLVIPKGKDDMPEVIDHKTTSSFRYAKTAEELTQDTQMIIYAKHILENMPDFDEVRLTHIAYLAKEPYGEARKTTVVVSRSHVDRVFDTILKTVHDMLDAAQAPYNQQVKNKEYCYSYGKRCPYYSECHITLESTEIDMSPKQMEVLNKLRGGKTEQPSVSHTVQMAAVAASVAPQVTAPAAPAAVTSVSGVSGDSVSGDSGKLTLYVDCMPAGEAVTTMQAQLEPLMKQIAAREKSASLELIPYSAGWSHLLEALPAQATADAVVSSASPLYQRCGWKLHQMFDRVVVGVR